MHISRRLRRSPNLCFSALLCASVGAHAAAGDTCTQAVQGSTIAASGYGSSCMSVGNLSLEFYGDENDHKMLVEQASPNSLVMSYTDGGSYFFGGSGRSESGELVFGSVATIKPADGFVVNELSMKAYVTADVYGPARMDYVYGKTGQMTTASYEKSIVVNISEQDTLASIQRMLVSYYVPYAQGSNGSASVYSTASFTIDKVVYSASVVAVPEPGTWALMGFGLLGVGMAARKRAR